MNSTAKTPTYKEFVCVTLYIVGHKYAEQICPIEYGKNLKRQTFEDGVLHGVSKPFFFYLSFTSNADN